jgi:hypothetical protein
MAAPAITDLLIGIVDLMTVQTRGNESVFVIMAAFASLRGMRAGEFLQLFGRSAMAESAPAADFFLSHSRCRSVRIFMTEKALCRLFSMNQIVAITAFGH